MLVNFRLAFKQLFDRPALKLRQPSDTRWLACDEAVQTLKCSLEPLTKALEDIANSDDGDAIYSCWLSWNFAKVQIVSCVFFMAEVLPILTRLPKIFQTQIYLSLP